LGVDNRTTRIYYHGEDGISHDTLVSVTSSAIDPPQLSVRWQSATLSAEAGKTVSIPIMWRAASLLPTPLGVQSISLRFLLRTDLLTPQSITVGTGAASLQLDHDTCTATIDLPPGYKIPPDSILATLECKVFITDTFSTQISRADIFVSATHPNCLTLSRDTNSLTFTLTSHCGDTLLSEFLDAPPFVFDGIVPNPARDEISIAWHGSSPPLRPVAYELFDPLGRVTLAGPDVRNTKLRLDALASGTYYLRLSQGGYVRSGRVAIER
jgi:hypothetical protein